MNQLDIDFVKDRRDDGIARSAANSGDDWQDAAFQCLQEYAKRHGQFMTEDVRFDAAQLAAPPTAKAWGQVVRRAKKEGVIADSGTCGRAKSSNLSPKPLWQSLICEVVA